MVNPNRNTHVPESSLDSLIDDVKRRPAPYATLAAIGVAGALLLSVRAAPMRGGSLEHRARRALGSGLHSAKRALHEGAERLNDGTDSVHGGVDTLGERLSELLSDHLGRHEPTLGERTRQAASNVGMSQSAVAVFAGTLLTKAVTGYLRLRAEERARSQSQSLSAAQDRDFEERLNALSESELRAIASDRGVRNADARDKPELIEALNRA